MALDRLATLLVIGTALGSVLTQPAQGLENRCRRFEPRANGAMIRQNPPATAADPSWKQAFRLDLSTPPTPPRPACWGDSPVDGRPHMPDRLRARLAPEASERIAKGHGERSGRTLLPRGDRRAIDRPASGGTLAGTVIAATDRLPIGEAFVQAVESASFAWYYEVSDSDGSFHFEGLPAGNYRLAAWTMSGAYIGEWWDDAETWDQADELVLGDGQTIADVTIDLERGATISGVIVDAATGEGVAMSWATVSRVGTDYFTYAGVADDDGHFTLVGLPAGDYILQAWDGTGFYASGSPTGPISVIADATVSDVRLEFEGTLGGVRGRLTAAATGDPVRYAWLIATDPSGGWSTNGGWAYGMSDGRGRYRLGLPQGGEGFVLQAYPWEGNLVDAYHPGTRDLAAATVFSLEAGDVLDGVDFSLPSGGVLSGQVLERGSDLPIAGAYVYAWSQGPTSWDYGSAIADGDGRFRVEGLTSGLYVLWAGDPIGEHVSRFYPSNFDWTTAVAIEVVEGQDASDRDVRLPLAGAIAGKVTTPDGSSAAGTWVSTWSVDGLSWQGATVDADGAFRLPGLEAGKYYVTATPISAALIPIWWKDATRYEGATPVAVELGATTAEIDIALREGGHAIGRVVDGETGAGLAGSSVIAIRVADDWAYDQRWGVADDGGQFAIAGLAPGEWVFEAWEASGRYLPSFAGGDSWESATRFAVEGAETIGPIEIPLLLGGSISGRIADRDSGQPLSWVNVWLEPLDDGTSWGSAFTDENGDYTIGGLRTGHYLAQAQPWDGVHLGLYYEGAQDREDAQPIAVERGETTPGIDFALPVGAKLSGRVTAAATGAALPYIEIWVMRGGSFVGWGYSSYEDGRFEISTLPAGSVTVVTHDWSGQYADQWYSGSATAEGATPIELTEGGVVTDIDFALVPVSGARGRSPSVERRR